MRKQLWSDMPIEVIEGMSDQQTFQAKHGLILYGSPHNNGIQIATEHDIELSETGQPELQAGKFLSSQQLQEQLRQWSGETGKQLQWLPSHILALGAHGMMWSEPAHRRNLFFADENLNGEYPLPNLLYCVIARRMWIYTLATAGRPSINSILYRAPLYNVSETGELCQGSARMPTKLDVTNTSAWSNAVLNSAGTHIKSKFSKGKHDAFMRAWRELEKFPVSKVLPSQMTLKELCAQSSQRH